MQSLFEGIEETQTASAPQFYDAKFFTAKEKERAYKCFQRVIKNRDINKMDKNLYNHLHLHCSFIAHYNMLGFKEEFSGRNFRRFIQHFDRNAPGFGEGALGWWIKDSDYRDINEAMVELVTSVAPQIYHELDNLEAQEEKKLAKALAKKHGLKVVEEQAG
ncbi:MAG: hypothetical protein K9L17_13410 [Clostridiales bacterium]|nr:hypothetical protein [Clostridiales bacterium]MCF8023673.1 hypothetical protein [Clostridiales bacterium]